jgi:large subunit ribosomal protein L17
MAASLFQHETISTTPQKAKEVKPFVEKLISLAKKGDLSARRKAIKLLGGDRNMVVEKEGESEKQGTVINKLFSELGPRYLERQGGYTRIIRLSLKRMGDKGRLVLLQLIGENEKVEEKTSKTETAAETDATEQQVVTAEPVEEPAQQQQTEDAELIEQTHKADDAEKKQQGETEVSEDTDSEKK